MVEQQFCPIRNELTKSDGIMETPERNPTTLAWLLATFIGLAVSGSLYRNNNRTLANRFDQAEQRADSLLSVKLQLEGDLRSLTSQLETATDENAYLNKRVDDLHSQFGTQSDLACKFRHSAISRARTIQHLNQSIGQLTIQRDSMDNQMVAMRDKINWLTNINTSLRNQVTGAKPLTYDFCLPKKDAMWLSHPWWPKWSGIITRCWRWTVNWKSFRKTSRFSRMRWGLFVFRKKRVVWRSWPFSNSRLNC